MEPNSWWHLTPEKTATCFILYMLGQYLHLTFVKIPSLRRQAAANNAPFTAGSFWRTEWNIITGSLVIPVVALILMSALVDQAWMKTFINAAEVTFAFGGFAGSSAILSKYGKMNPFLNSIANEKVNEFDAENPERAQEIVAQAKVDTKAKTPKAEDTK